MWCDLRIAYMGHAPREGKLELRSFFGNVACIEPRLYRILLSGGRPQASQQKSGLVSFHRNLFDHVSCVTFTSSPSRACSSRRVEVLIFPFLAGRILEKSALRAMDT